MTVYNYLDIFFIILFFLEINSPKTKKYRHIFFLLGALALIFVLGFRNYNVGGDTPAYVNFFTGKGGFYGSINNSELEVGFILFSKILRFVSSYWQWFIFAISVFSLIPFLWYVKKNAAIVTFPFLTFLLGWDLLWMIQTPFRQDIAITLFFIGGNVLISKQIKSVAKKIIIASLFIVWGMFTHTTMIIVTPLAILCYLIPFKKKWVYVALFLSMIIPLFVNNLFGSVYEFLHNLTVSYDMFKNMNQYYGSAEYEINDVATFNTVAPKSIFTFLIIYLSDNSQLKQFNLKCLVFACCLFNLGATFPLVTRIVLFFSLVGASFVPNAIVHFRRLKNLRKVGFYVLILLFFLFVNKHIQFCSNFKLKIDSDVLPYSFWFEHL